MQMVHMIERQERVQRSIDGCCYSILAKRREWIIANHFIFMLLTAVQILELFKAVEIQQSESGFSDRAQISATAFDGEHAYGTASKRIGKLQLGTCVSSAEVGNAQIRAEEVGTIA